MSPRPATRADVIAAVRALPTGRTRWVGIDGLGASGKSTLAEHLVQAVSGCVVVETDDLQGEGITEWDWPAFQRDVVDPLGRGRPGRYAVRAWGEREPDGYTDVPVGAVVVVEGVSATRGEIRVPWDLTVWVDAPEPVRRARAVERDGPAIAAIWRDHWIPTETAYAERQRPWTRVDLIVDGTVVGRG